ncbi:unnamed protein product [Rotaria sordida]|uniref:CKK domain-containing protein n=1 Tax=Rotaria sordida TaxID=392033 RepID=A0A814XBZ7_9BILA|nr:unnamed protein product [Rotaria sordida]CAF1491890.1 unnamed protein product [Rotaria sordida]
MTTMVTTTNSEVTTPTSYVSRWIAQSHGKYQRKSNEYYSSSCNYQTSTTTTTTTPIIKMPTKTNLNSRTTTWQAQAKSRLENTTTTITSDSLLNTSNTTNNNELQEKLNRVRALLDAKKQRLYRHISSASPPSSTTTIPLVTHSLQDQVHNSTTVGDQSSSPPLSTSSSLALDNVYHSNDESLSSSNSAYVYNSCNHHHHHHSLPSILPCLMEESPSDSGLSDGTKTTNNDDINEPISKNAAIIDLSKPLSKEEMLAIIQIIRELWKKQFDYEMPDIQLKPILPTTSFKRIGEISNLSNNNKTQYHSTPALNKLSAELNEIKDKLKRFSTEHQQPLTDMRSTEFENNQLDIDDNPCYEDPIFVSFDTSLTPEDLERMQAKKDALLRRQNQRREEQSIKNQERQEEAAERYDEYRLFEEYLSQRRQDEDQRRTNILQSHIEQKRFDIDSLSSNDYYFAAARNRNRLKRKSSISSFHSFDDELSYNSSYNFMQTPKRSMTRFDLMSPSLTAPTAASKSKMNRAASICNINGHYDSFTSLNSKGTTTTTTTTTIPTNLFGGSLMNLSKAQTPKRRSLNLMDDTFDDSQFCTSMTSLATSVTGARIARSQTLLSTKSNKQAILNSLKQVILAGSANERQREIIIREIESSEARHFVLLFRDHRLQFRAVYMYIPETDIIEKLYGIGPNIITEIMVDKWFKYNSGSKRFTNIPIKHFSIQCDAIILHNDFWHKKLVTNMNKIH